MRMKSVVNVLHRHPEFLLRVLWQQGFHKAVMLCRLCFCWSSCV